MDDAIPIEAKNWAVVAHLSALVGVLGIPPLVGPLVVWLLKRDVHPFVDEAGKEALNFNITFFLYLVVSALSIFVLVGVVLLPVVVVAWFVLVVIGTVRTSEGVSYRYPLTIRFVS